MTDLAIAPRENFRYTSTEKDNLLFAYLEHGKLSEACRITGYGYEAAKALSKTEDFQRGLAALKTERNAQLDSRLTAGIDKALEAVHDRLDKGEQRVTKSGEVVTIKPGLAAVTMAAGVLYDKRALLRGEHIAATPENVLEKLAEKLRNFARKQDAIDVDARVLPANPVEGVHEVSGE